MPDDRDSAVDEILRKFNAACGAEEGARTLRWADIASWDDRPVPEREWSVPDRVPLRQVGLFSGEGGTGKSIIELTRNTAHVIGRDWLGSLPAQGPTIYIGTEDEEDEIHRRLAAIADNYGVSFTELASLGLHVLCLLGEDAVLCRAERSGEIVPTPLYKLIFEAAGDLKPKNISIDTLSRAFTGNEIDRVQVYAFAQHMQALATVANGSVTVLSHPSLNGIANGSGISGSTAWHGAFRFRQYLTGVKAEGDAQPDNDLRALSFRKNQYGPLSPSVTLRYQNGLFVPEGGASSLDQAAQRTKAERVFMALLSAFSDEGRHVSSTPGVAFAPALFAKDPRCEGVSKRALDGAMSGLFAAGRIRMEEHGRPSKRRTHIVEVPR